MKKLSSWVSRLVSGAELWAHRFSLTTLWFPSVPGTAAHTRVWDYFLRRTDTYVFTFFFFTHDKIYHNIRLFVLLCPPPPVPEWQTVFTVRLVVTVTPLRHHVLLSLSLSLSLCLSPVSQTDDGSPIPPCCSWCHRLPWQPVFNCDAEQEEGSRMWVCVCVYLIMCFYEKLISSWVNPVMFYFQHVSSVLLFFFLFFF